MIYQLRDQHGRKIYERDRLDELLHFATKLQLPSSHYEVWTLTGIPGELKDIQPLTNFFQHHEPKKTR